MAQAPTAYTAPSATAKTELYYTTSETGGTLKQIFGVQGIPKVITAKEDVTYRTLESDMEFSVKGVRPYEAIEIETIFIKEQFVELSTIAKADTVLWWYVKLPDVQSTVIKWSGGVDVSISEVALDDMIKMALKIGKSTAPEIIDQLPQI